METKLVAGREFVDTDDARQPLRMIVNETFARKILRVKQPQDAVGRRAPTNEKVHEIVGVAADGKYTSLAESPKPVMFLSLWQDYSSKVRLVARGDGEVLIRK